MVIAAGDFAAKIKNIDDLFKGDPSSYRILMTDRIRKNLLDYQRVFKPEEIEFSLWLANHLELVHDIKYICAWIPVHLKTSDVSRFLADGGISNTTIYGYYYTEAFRKDSGYSTADEILLQSGLTKMDYWKKIVPVAEEKIKERLLSEVHKEGIDVKDYKRIAFMDGQGAPARYYQVRPGYPLDKRVRYYLTLNPLSLPDVAEAVFGILLELTRRNQRCYHFKFWPNYRKDSLVIYGDLSILPYIRQLPDGLFLQDIIPFTQRIANGRGYGENKGREINEKVLNKALDEASNGAVFCKLISEVYNTFVRKYKRFPSGNLDYFIVAVGSLYPLFRNKINVHH